MIDANLIFLPMQWWILCTGAMWRQQAWCLALPSCCCCPWWHAASWASSPTSVWPCCLSPSASEYTKASCRPSRSLMKDIRSSESFLSNQKCEWRQMWLKCFTCPLKRPYAANHNEGQFPHLLCLLGSTLNKRWHCPRTWSTNTATWFWPNSTRPLQKSGACSWWRTWWTPSRWAGHAECVWIPACEVLSVKNLKVAHTSCNMRRGVCGGCPQLESSPGQLYQEWWPPFIRHTLHRPICDDVICKQVSRKCGHCFYAGPLALHITHVLLWRVISEIFCFLQVKFTLVDFDTEAKKEMCADI